MYTCYTLERYRRFTPTQVSPLARTNLRSRERRLVDVGGGGRTLHPAAAFTYEPVGSPAHRDKLILGRMTGCCAMRPSRRRGFPPRALISYGKCTGAAGQWCPSVRRFAWCAVGGGIIDDDSVRFSRLTQPNESAGCPAMDQLRRPTTERPAPHRERPPRQRRLSSTHTVYLFTITCTPKESS